MADGTRARLFQIEMEGITGMFQEMMKKMDAFEARLASMESASQSRGNKGMVMEEEEETVEKSVGRHGWANDRVTRQTKVEFPSFDGTGIQEWLFRSERFFELDGTPPELKVLLGFSAFVGASAWVDLLGMIAGHAYYFLEDIYPRMTGRRPLRTPSFITALFADDAVVVERPAHVRFAAPPAEELHED